MEQKTGMSIFPAGILTAANQSIRINRQTVKNDAAMSGP